MIPAEHPEHGMIREVRIGKVDSISRWVVIFHDGATYNVELGTRLGDASPTLEQPRKFKGRGKGGTGN